MAFNGFPEFSHSIEHSGQAFYVTVGQCVGTVLELTPQDAEGSNHIQWAEYLSRDRRAHV